MPAEQASKCTIQVFPRVQNFTGLSGSTLTLYVSSGTNLYALDAANGAPHWCDQLSQSQPGTSSNSQADDIAALALDHTNLYTYANNVPSTLTAFNPTNGSLRWSYTRGAGSLDMRIGVNFVNAPTAHQTVYDGLSTVYALREQDGTIRWQKELDKKHDILTSTPPVVGEGMVYMGVTDQWKSGIVALDATNGNQKWLIEWPRSFEAGGQAFVSGNLLVDQDRVFFSSGEQLAAVDARTGVSVWQDQVNPSDDPLFGANGLLYVQGSPNTNSEAQNLYAIDMRTGSIRWSLPLSSRLYLLSGNNIYLFSEDGLVTNNTGYDLAAINAQNGKELWHTHYKLAHSETGTTWKLVILNNEVYMGVELTGTGTFAVHAFHLRSGIEDWSATVFGDVRGSGPNNVTFIDMVGSQ